MRWSLARVRLPFPFRRLPAVCLGLGVTSFAPGALGQEALVSAVQQDQAYQTRQEALTVAPDDRLHAGPVNFFVAPAFTTEWNDNVNLSPSQPEADFILRPQVSMGALWPASDNMRLNLEAGVGYAWYVEGHRQNEFLITPNSNLALDFPGKDVLITVYDQAAYANDLTANAALDSTGNNANVQNTAGLRGAWSVGDGFLQAGYAHFNYFALNRSDEYLNRASELFIGRAGYALAAATRAGIEASGSLTAYDLPLRSNFHSVSVGPFLEWWVTTNLQCTARGGYLEYISEATAVLPAPANMYSYYFELAAKQQLTRSLSHEFRAVRDVQVGTTSAFIEQLTVGYGVGWAATEFARLAGGVVYEHGEEPGYLVDENYERISFSFGVSYDLTQRLTSSIGYRYQRRDSNIPGQNYQQNSVTLGVAYRF
jgi:predicted porin